MANSRSARKRIRSSERKHERNRAVKSAVRTKVIKARHALLDEGGAGGDQADRRGTGTAHDRERNQHQRPNRSPPDRNYCKRLRHRGCCTFVPCRRR